MKSKTHYRKYAVTTLAAAAAVAAVAPVAASAESIDFSDVNEKSVQDKEMREAIGSLADQGAITGYGERVFKPYESIYRGQIAQIMTEALNLPIPEDVDKINEQYEDADKFEGNAKYIAAVTQAGIFHGKEAQFNNWKPITREQMATILERYLSSLGIEANNESDVKLDNVSESHKDGVQYLADLGMTTQTDDFRPGENVTRAQFATFFVRAQELIQANTVSESVITATSNAKVNAAGIDIFSDGNIEATATIATEVKDTDNQISITFDNVGEEAFDIEKLGGSFEFSINKHTYLAEKAGGIWTIQTAEAKDIKDFVSQFDSAAAMQDIETLVENGPRVTGTEEEKIAIKMIRDRVEGLGYQVEQQDFDLPVELSGMIESEHGDYHEVRIAGGKAGTVEGQLIDAGLGDKGDFSKDVDGKVALIERGEFTFQKKVDNAAEAGATAVIIYNNQDNDSIPNFSVESDIPVAGVTKKDGDKLSENTGETVSFNIVAEETKTSANIIATKYPENDEGEPIKDADIVHVSAHLDSVPGAPGANDNGAGTATALEMARVMKDMPVDKEIRFEFVGAEEIGLVGSKKYVESLSKEEIDRSIANFNMDMVATSWDKATAIYTNTLDGKHNLVTKTAHRVADIIGTPSELVLYKRGASDHENFHEIGIDAANFIRRDPATHDLEPDYHQPGDTMDNVSEERLKENIDLVGGSIYTLVRKK